MTDHPMNVNRNNGREIEENNAWDHLSKWETLVEERIRALIGDGDMSWHPKAGQRLEFDDERVPDDQRLANKIMKDNDAVPPWMALGFTLRDKHEKITRKAKQFARDYVRRRDDAIKRGSFLYHQKADDRWKKATSDLRIEIGKYNAELLNYNLQVPQSIPQMIPLDPDKVINSALSKAESR